MPRVAWAYLWSSYRLVPTRWLRFGRNVFALSMPGNPLNMSTAGRERRKRRRDPRDSGREKRCGDAVKRRPCCGEGEPPLRLHATAAKRDMAVGLTQRHLRRILQEDEADRVVVGLARAGCRAEIRSFPSVGHVCCPPCSCALQPPLCHASELMPALRDCSYQFGVYTGGTIGSISRKIGNFGHLWGFDSFVGLPEETTGQMLEGKHWRVGGFSAADALGKYDADALLRHITEFIGRPNTTLIRGYFN